MAKKRTKLIVLIVVLSVLLVFTACTGQQSSTQGTTTKSTTTQGTTTQGTTADPFGRFSETVTIHIGKTDTFAFYGQNDDYKSPENNVWIDNIKEKLNVEFAFDWIATEANAGSVKWNTAIASNTLPDMGIIDRVTYESLLEAGKIADMTDSFYMYGSPRYIELTDDNEEKSYQTRNGRLYGLPLSNASPQRFDMLIVRQDWLDKVDMKAPKTIDELVEVATAFKEAQLGGPNTYGLALGKNASWGSYKGFFQGYGIPFSVWALNDKGEVYYGNTDDRMKDALLKLQSMYKAGLLKQDYAIANTVESVTAGEAGMLYSICFGPVNAVDLYMLDEEVDMIGAEIPTIDGSLPIYYDSAVPGSFIFVNSDYDNQEAAVKVVNQIVENLFDLSYDWGYIRNVCPIGGVMFEKYMSFAEYAREIEYAYKTGDTTKFTTANAKIYYDRTIKFEAGDRSLGKYHPIYRIDVGTYAIIDDALQSNRIKNTVYVAADTETMTEKFGMLNEVLNIAIDKVIMGADVSVWESAVAEWYATGGQTITDEVNAWYKDQ